MVGSGGEPFGDVRRPRPPRQQQGASEAFSGADDVSSASEWGARRQPPPQQEQRRGAPAQITRAELVRLAESGEVVAGVVTAVKPYGVFVDIGAERPGLVHISEVRDGFVSDIANEVAPGENVNVRVLRVESGGQGGGRDRWSSTPPPFQSSWSGATEGRRGAASASGGDRVALSMKQCGNERSSKYASALDTMLEWGDDTWESEEPPVSSSPPHDEAASSDD